MTAKLIEFICHFCLRRHHAKALHHTVIVHSVVRRTCKSCYRNPTSNYNLAYRDERDERATIDRVDRIGYECGRCGRFSSSREIDTRDPTCPTCGSGVEERGV